MRVGVRPSFVRRKDFRSARVTVCMVVCIPDEFGYFTHRLDVLKLSLRSLAANTPPDSFDLMVLDNGSCAPVVDYLRTERDRGGIDYLVLLPRNIGKMSACQLMCQAAPGDIVAYSDDDVFFDSGWLQAQLEVLDTYPRVGMVSGRPVRKMFGYGNQYLPAYLAEFPEISATYGHIIPDSWEIEYLCSTGRSLAGLESIKQKRTDVLLEYRGVKAYSTATHFQFLAPKAVIMEGLNLAARGTTHSDERYVEESIDGLGYARLSTFGRHVRHIGNVISADLLADVEAALPAAGDLDVWAPPPSWLVRLTRPPWVRAVLRRLNRSSYRLLHHPAP